MPRYDDDDRYGDLGDIRIGSRRPDRDAGQLQQSGAGLTSVVIAVLMFLAFLFFIAIAAVMDANNNGPMRDDDPRAIVLGLGILGGFGLNITGLVLGIVGCCQPNRSSACGVIGTVLNGLLLFGMLFLICIGLAMG